MNPSARASEWLAAQLSDRAEKLDELRRFLDCDGEFSMSEFQKRAALRGTRIVEQHGGVLLADGPGLGKTRTALAISSLCWARAARSGPQTLLVCAPARLEKQWRRAVEVLDKCSMRFVSHAALSRGNCEAWGWPQGAVVVDEAHQFCNPETNRYSALADVSWRADLILVSATPFRNSVWDVYHLLRLFLPENIAAVPGSAALRSRFEWLESGACELDFHWLNEFIIRRTERAEADLIDRNPEPVLEVLAYEASDIERRLWNNLEAYLDDLTLAGCPNWSRGLFVQHLLYRWESDPRSFCESLENLCRYFEHWLKACEQGVELNRKRFRALFGEKIPVSQQVLPFWYKGDRKKADELSFGDSGDLAQGVRQDLEKTRHLLELSRAVSESKNRFRPVRRLVRRSEKKLILFTRYTSTAKYIYRQILEALGGRAKAGLICGERSLSTGPGRLRDADILRRFAPESVGNSDIPESEQLDILVATDCLSQGVNLQDADAIFLLDFPPSLITLEQRIGRVLRPGQTNHRVPVYAIRPLRRTEPQSGFVRLRNKLATARELGTRYPALDRLFDSDRGQNCRSDRRASRRFSVQTRMDAVAGRVCKQNRQLEGAGRGDIWQLRDTRNLESLLFVVRVRADDRSRQYWGRFSPGRGVSYASPQVADFVEYLADTNQRAIEKGGPDWAAKFARNVNQRFENLLVSASLRPNPVDSESKQLQIWRKIKPVLESEQTDRVLSIRSKMFQSRPIGMARRIRHVWESKGVQDRSVFRLLKNMKDYRVSDIRVEFVSGLCLPEGRLGFSLVE